MKKDLSIRSFVCSRRSHSIRGLLSNAFHFLLLLINFSLFKSLISNKKGLGQDDNIQVKGQPSHDRVQGKVTKTTTSGTNDFLRHWSHCPLVLTATHQTAGLGHAFMSFNQIINTAAENAMLPNISFPSRLLHSVDQKKVEKIFCGPLFRPRNFAGVCRSNMKLDSWERRDTTLKRATDSCRRDHIVCVDVDTEFPTDGKHFDTQLYRSNMCIYPMFAPSEKTLNVVMHIRRGDTTGVSKYRTRWAYNRSYMDLISILKRKFVEYSLNFTIITEGSENVSLIQDADGTWSSFAGLHSQLRIGPKDPIDSFLTMCDADILVTGLSGFSYLAALLCQPKLTLGMPFWHRFDNIQGSVILEVAKDAHGSVTEVLGIPEDIATKFS